MPNALLNIIVPPAMEDLIVDWLLEQSYVKGFTSYPVYGHGVNPENLSLAEQVTSRQRKIKFEVNGTEEEIQAAIKSLKANYRNSDIYYWALSVFDGGYIS